MEKTKRTSNKWCSCGYKQRREGANELHLAGTHHKAGKKIVEVKTGVKTNIGDPGDNIGSKK